MTAKQTLYVIPNPTLEDSDWCVISEHPVFGGHQFQNNADGDPLEAVALPYEEIPALCGRLMDLYNQRMGNQLATFSTPASMEAEADVIRLFGGD